MSETIIFYINYGENQEGAGKKELRRFRDELLRQYNGNFEALEADSEIWNRGQDCDRYYDAEFAATKFAFSEWSRQPERVSFLVEIGRRDAAGKFIT